MKMFKTLFTLLILSSSTLLATLTCSESPSTNNITSTSITNTAGAQDIDSLEGKDCSGANVNGFRILTLPDANMGILTMADGTTAVQANQNLTAVEAAGLKFNPVTDFTGSAVFTYGSVDENGYVDLAGASVTIPVTDTAAGGAGHPGQAGGQAGQPGGQPGQPGGQAGGACINPTTEDLMNPNLPNTLGAANILDLSGKDCDNHDVESFRIVTLPDAAAGVLYMADGVTAVEEGQTLTREEANGLRFDSTPDFVGNATFTYAAIDGNGHIDPTPATVTIPLTNDGEGAAGAGAGAGAGNCTCDDYETSVPSLSISSLLALALLVSAAGIFFTRREKLN